jgi:hypothetical protein
MAIEMFIELIKALGSACIDKNMDDLTTSIIKLLENKND